MCRSASTPVFRDIRRHDRRRRIKPAAARAATVTHRSVLDGSTEVLSFIHLRIIKPTRPCSTPDAAWAGWCAAAVQDVAFQSRRSLLASTAPSHTHEANPLIEENRRDIVARVQSTRAEIGIAWDGDADRCFFIDEDGEFVSGDFVTALLAEAFMLKEPGATVVYDLRASYAVKDMAAKYGGKAVMNRVGHAFFKGRMRELNAVFGGEVTGHYYFRENFYCDNGFIPAVLILELMSKKNQSCGISSRSAKYFISGEINTKVATMTSRPRRLRDRSALQGRRHLEARGISIEYRTALQRAPSNTEPLLRLNLEGTTPAQMEANGTKCLRSFAARPDIDLHWSLASSPP